MVAQKLYFRDSVSKITMDNNVRLKLTLWGVRGSTPTPKLENLSYGGNTPCVEVRSSDGEIFIFDGGSGIRQLGDSLLEEFDGRLPKLRVFLTHYHWDHIQGIPFFQPLYNEDTDVRFYAVENQEEIRRHRRGQSKNALEEAVRMQMENPYFPISFSYLSATTEFIEIPQQTIKFGPLSITPFPLNHPGHTFGYRIEADGAAVVYATDLEHGHQYLDRILRDTSSGADLLIYDSQYTPEDYDAHKGWGHSTWQKACEVASDAEVRQLALFHHDPSYDDGKCHQITEDARRNFENSMGAKEGWSLIL